MGRRAKVRGGVLSGSLLLAAVAAVLLSGLVAVGLQALASAADEPPVQVGVRRVSGDVAVPDAASSIHSRLAPTAAATGPATTSLSASVSASEGASGSVPPVGPRPVVARPAVGGSLVATPARGSAPPATASDRATAAPAASASQPAPPSPSPSPSRGRGRGRGHHH